MTSRGIEAMRGRFEVVCGGGFGNDRDFGCFVCPKWFLNRSAGWVASEGAEFLAFAEDLLAGYDIEGEGDDHTDPVH